MFLLLLLFTAALGLLLLYFLVPRQAPRTIPTGEGWWGVGERSALGNEDESIVPFRIEMLEETVKDLHHRLDETRLIPPLEDARFHYGFNSRYLRKVLDYWRNQFDWKKQVDILNSVPHFKTRIEGIEVHFVHVKPGGLPEGRAAIPLLMVHGWPGSFYEFYKILPLLTEPEAHGLSQEHVFQVVCPSIPGYGFSEAPHKQGFDTMATARMLHSLMCRLGFQHYYVQGGDWGSHIATNMAQMNPQLVKGIHLNFFPITQIGPRVLLSVVLGKYVPSLVGLTSNDMERLFPFMQNNIYELLRESGYMHIQATKPDSLGSALNDSPAGLAAYILEKFSTWTSKEFRDQEDGGLERFTLDELLTNVMIYWVTGSITSSMRFYRENLKGNPNKRIDAKVKIHVPTGLAAFPQELGHTPLVWAQQMYKNVLSYSYMARGGHFAAFEEPGLLAEDIQRFVRIVEQRA